MQSLQRPLHPFNGSLTLRVDFKGSLDVSEAGSRAGYGSKDQPGFLTFGRQFGGMGSPSPGFHAVIIL